MVLWHLLSMLWVWGVIMFLECLVCAWQGCWCQGCSSKWPRHSSSFMEFVLHQWGHFEKYKDVPGREEILASRSPIRIASCGLFLCSAGENGASLGQSTGNLSGHCCSENSSSLRSLIGEFYSRIFSATWQWQTVIKASQPSSQPVFTKYQRYLPCYVIQHAC